MNSRLQPKLHSETDSILTTATSKAAMKEKRLWKCKSMYHPKRKTSVCRIQSRVAREERQESETSEFRQNDRDARGGG